MATRFGPGALGDSPVATLLHVTWTFAGHAVALFAAVQIVLSGGGRATTADAVLWLAALAVVVSRWFEVTRWGAPGRAGEPVTVEQFWRFVALVLLGTLLLWSTAHALGWAVAQ